MVASSAFGRTFVLGAMLAVVSTAGGCGGESVRTVGSGGSAGRIERGGSGTGTGTGTAGRGAGTGDDAIELDGPRCETRRVGNCAGVASVYSSNSSTFASAPELAACASYVSFDGCGDLIYSFDFDGCAVSVDPGPGGWKNSEHLAPLRDCLSKVFGDARFACLSSGTLAFNESCMIR